MSYRTATAARRVFIAPVSEPTNGAWHDLSDYVDCEELEAAARARITCHAGNGFAEELDCPDYEGFGDEFKGCYYVGVQDAWRVHEWLEACEAQHVEADIALAYRANFIGDRELPDPEVIRDAYVGTYASAEDFALGWAQDVVGDYATIPEDYVGFIDWDAKGQEMLSDGFWSARVDAGIAVFHNN